MPMKLLFTIFLLACVTIFCGVNSGYKCNINLLFKTLNDVPVFVTIMVSFFLGVLVMLPACFLGRSKNKKPLYAQTKPNANTKKTKHKFFAKTPAAKNASLATAPQNEQDETATE